MGLLDTIRSALPWNRSPVPMLPEPELVDRDGRSRLLRNEGDPETRAWMERALVQGDLGITAVSMSGAQPPQRRGNVEAMRAYATGPWLRGVVGRVSSACASVQWKLYVAPAMGTASRNARMRYDDIVRSGWKAGARPDELLDVRGQERHNLVRDMHIAGELVEVQRHPWHQLMRKPNSTMSGRVAREVIVSSHAIVGDAALVLGSDGGSVPQRMWPIPGVWIQRRPTISEPWWVIQIGAGSTSANATLWTVPWDALLPFTDADPLQPYGRGIGLGFTLGDEVDIDEAAAKTVSAFFHNFGVPAALVSIRGARGAALEKAKRDWNNLYQGFKKAYRAQFTGGEIDVKRMDTTFNDMQLVELRKAQRDVFTQVFGVPPEIMGNNQNSSWATSSAADAIFAKHAMVPRLEVMREQFQRLAEMFDPRLIVEYENPIPVDREHRLKVMEKFPTHFRVNEVRNLGDEGPTGDLAGDGFIDKDGVWWANLTELSPKMLPADINGGIPSVDERRQYLRLPALGADAGGDEPSPRRVTKTGAVTPTDPELPPEDQADVDVAAQPVDANGNPTSPAPAATLAPAAKAAPGRRDPPHEPAAGEKTHLTPDEVRQVCMGVDVASMFDAIHEPVKAGVQAYGQHTLDGLDLDDSSAAQFDTASQRVRRHMRELGTSTVPAINSTTKDRLKDAIHKAERDFHDSVTSDQAFSGDPQKRSGGGSFREAIMEGIRLVFGDDARADMIGATEGTRAASAGFDAALDQAPDDLDIKKVWIATMDDVTRDTHFDMDGQEQDPEDDFESPAGGTAEGPGLFDDPAEDANCRCVAGTMVGAGPSEDARALKPGHTHEHRRDAYAKAHAVIEPHRKAIATAARAGFDRQYVRVVAALDEVLKAY